MSHIYIMILCGGLSGVLAFVYFINNETLKAIPLLIFTVLCVLIAILFLLLNMIAIMKEIQHSKTAEFSELKESIKKKRMQIHA